MSHLRLRRLRLRRHCLLLRLSRFGRLALSAEQVTASNWLAAYLMSGAACLVVGLLRRDGRAMEAALEFGLLLLPVGGAAGCPAGWPRDAMKAVALGLTLIGPGASPTYALTPMRHSDTLAREADAAEIPFSQMKT